MQDRLDSAFDLSALENEKKAAIGILTDFVSAVKKANDDLKGSEGAFLTAKSTGEQQKNAQAAAKSYTELGLAVKEYEKITNQLSVAIAKSNALTSEDAKGLAAARVELAEFNRKLKEEAQAQNASYQARMKAIADRKEEARATKEQTKALKDQAQAKKAEEKAALDAAKAKAAEAKMIEDLSNDYLQLSKAYTDSANKAKLLGAAFGVNSQVFKTEAANAKALHDRLYEIDAAVGQHSRNVGNYTSTWNGLGMSIQQVARELPNFAQSVQLGILAISNNLPILADEIKRVNVENAALTKKGEASVSVWKQIGSAIFSWQTALVVGITILVAYGKELADLVTGINATDRALKDLGKKASESYIDQTKHLSTLTVEIENNATSTERLHQIRNEITSSYPGLKKQLEGETNLRGRLKDSINEVSQALIIYTRISAAEELIAEQQKRMLEGKLSAKNVLKGYFLGGITAAGQAATAISSEMLDMNATIDALIKKRDADIKKLREGGFDTLMGGGNADKQPKTKKNRFSEGYNEINSALKRRNDAQKEYDVQAYQQQQDAAQAIMDDEAESLENRLKALNDYYTAKNNIEALNAGVEIDTLEKQQKTYQQKLKDYNDGKLKLNKMQYNALILDIGTNDLKIKAINEKRETEMNKIDIDAANKRVDIEHSFWQKKLKEIQQGYEDIKNQITQEENVALAELDQKYADKLISERDYQKQRRQIISTAQNGIYDLEVDYLNDQLAKLKAMPGVTKEVVDAINNILGGLKKPRESGDGLNGLGLDDNEMRAINAYIDAAKATINGVGDVLEQQSKKRVKAIDDEIAAIEKRKDAEIAALDLTSLSEQQKADKKAEINAVAAQKEEALSQRKESEQKAAAQRAKTMAIAQIILNTAQAVMSVWAQPLTPYYVKIAESIAVGAVGAAQVATAIATPAYEKGTPKEGHKGGKARMGEKNKAELVIDPRGGMRVIRKDGLYDLEKGAHVVPLEGQAQHPLSSLMMTSAQIKAITAQQSKPFDNSMKLLEGYEKNTNKLIRELRGELRNNRPIIINNGQQAAWGRRNLGM